MQGILFVHWHGCREDNNEIKVNIILGIKFSRDQNGTKYSLFVKFYLIPQELVYKHKFESKNRNKKKKENPDRRVAVWTR